MGWPVGSLRCHLTDSLENEPISSSLHQLFRTHVQVMGIWSFTAESSLPFSQGIWGRQPQAWWELPQKGTESSEV